MYGKPERTLQPVKLEQDRVYGTRVSQNTNFFSGIDYWLFFVVYLSVAILLVFAFIHFRVRKIRFDFSYIFCRRIKHSYLGKNNV